MELGRSGRSMMMSTGAGGQAQPATGSSTTLRAALEEDRGQGDVLLMLLSDSVLAGIGAFAFSNNRHHAVSFSELQSRFAHVNNSANAGSSWMTRVMSALLFARSRTVPLRRLLLAAAAVRSRTPADAMLSVCQTTPSTKQSQG
jgi:hypothetical protein